MIEDLLFDLIVRVPKIKLVLSKDSYYLYDEGIKKPISKSWVGYLIVYGYAKRLPNGGIEITEKGIDIAHSVVQESIKVESKKHKGMFFDAYIPRKKFI